MERFEVQRNNLTIHLTHSLFTISEIFFILRLSNAKKTEMDLPSRLEQALTKLYTAFYQDRLDPENCKYCAVGNICDNQDFWKHFTDLHGSEQLNYLGRVNEEFGKRFKGYSPKELLKTEAVFLKGCGYTFSPRKRLLKPAEKIDRDMMFNGLYSAVAYSK